MGKTKGSTVAVAANRAWVGLLSLLLFGCASKSPLPVPTQESMPPVVLATLGDAGIKDLRHLYRAAVCAQLPPDSLPCEELILRFPEEASANETSAQTDINKYLLSVIAVLCVQQTAMKGA